MTCTQTLIKRATNTDAIITGGAIGGLTGMLFSKNKLKGALIGAGVGAPVGWGLLGRHLAKSDMPGVQGKVYTSNTPVGTLVGLLNSKTRNTLSGAAIGALGGGLLGSYRAGKQPHRGGYVTGLLGGGLLGGALGYTHGALKDKYKDAVRNNIALARSNSGLLRHIKDNLKPKNYAATVDLLTTSDAISFPWRLKNMSASLGVGPEGSKKYYKSLMDTIPDTRNELQNFRSKATEDLRKTIY